MARKITREALTLLEDAPIQNLRALLRAELSELAAGVPEPETDEARTRQALIQAAGLIQEANLRRFEDIAARIVKLGTGRGVDSLKRIVRTERSARLSEFEDQLDPLGASAWTWLEERAAFEDAESYQYANHFRNFGRLFAAFEVPASSATDLELETAKADALKHRIADELRLTGKIGLSHLRIDDDDRGEPAHLLIVRHGGSLASVAQYRDDGLRDHHYYHPPNEVTLVYLPRRGVVEVCGPSPAFRVDVAGCFAEVVLGQDLSKKPLAHKVYNLERFRESLKLSRHQPDGFRVDHVAVVEVEIRPTHEHHRLVLKVSPEDDIEEVAERLLGSIELFRTAAAVTRIVIAVRFRPEGARPTKTLNITVSGQNTSNLRSEPNPEYRRLGYELLEHWNVMQKLAAPTATDVRQLLPTLLQIYDSRRSKMPEQELVMRGVDAEKLATAGFLEQSGFEAEMLVDDEDGGPDLVETQPVRRDTAVEATDAQGRPYLLPPRLSKLYRIDEGWTEETIIKQLLPALGTKTLRRLDRCLVSLGAFEIEGQLLDWHLARGLNEAKMAKRLDRELRGEGRAGVVLNAGIAGPDFLGAHLVVSLPALLGTLAADETITTESLVLAYRQNRRRADGGATVEFREHADDMATLLIPGKPTLTLFASNQILIFRRLVDAYREGRPAVRAEQLTAGMKAASPSQAFSEWKEIQGTYILKVGKRDGWKLAA